MPFARMSPNLPATVVLSLLCIGSWSAGGARADDVPVYRGMAVSVIKAERRCFKNILQVSGVFVPHAEIQVRPDSEGMKISQVLIEPGDTVGSGQILARLMPPQQTDAAQSVPIRSPVSGIAIGVSAMVGSYASPSAPDAMFRIVVDGELELKGEVLAGDVPQLHIGQTATVQIQAIGQLEGRVAAIDNVVDAVTQLGTVRISVPPDPRLRSGVFAHADIEAGESCGVAVPLSAVLYGSEGAVVQVAHDDHVETRRVEVGILKQGTALILDGLTEADIVIARAGGFLREGDLIRPISAEAPAKP